MPIDPDFKKSGRYWTFALYPILSPQEIRGSGFIRWRYADPKRGDDIWDLAGRPRRGRRPDGAIMRSSPTTHGTLGPAGAPGHFSRFNPKTVQDFSTLLTL